MVLATFQGRAHRCRVVLNQADAVALEDLLRVHGAIIYHLEHDSVAIRGPEVPPYGGRLVLGKGAQEGVRGVYAAAGGCFVRCSWNQRQLRAQGVGAGPEDGKVMLEVQFARGSFWFSIFCFWDLILFLFILVPL